MVRNVELHILEKINGLWNKHLYYKHGIIGIKYVASFYLSYKLCKVISTFSDLNTHFMGEELNILGI